MLGVPGQYKSVALMLGYKLDFSCCANKDGFCRDSYIYHYIYMYVGKHQVWKFGKERRLVVVGEHFVWQISSS